MSSLSNFQDERKKTISKFYFLNKIIFFHIKFLFILLVILFFNCSNNNYNLRYFHFDYEVEIESTEGKKIELWIPVPQSNEVQTISQLSFQTSGLDYQLKTESKHQNKYLYIYSNEGTTENKYIKMSFNVLRKEHNNVDYKDVNPDDYLVSYSHVPIGDIFSNIINDNSLNKYDIKGIYNFVLSDMHYGKPKNSTSDDAYYSSKNPNTNEQWLPDNQVFGRLKVGKNKVVDIYQKSKKMNTKYTFGNGNSLYACDIGVGNCTDFHSYFMSLGRTLEIPIRFHMGFPIPTQPEGKVGGYHCWADYYVDGEGWYPVDISEADKDPGKAEYFFGTICKNRVDFMVGRDFKIDNYEEESVNLFIYPLLEVDDIKSNKYTKIFRYKNL